MMTEVGSGELGRSSGFTSGLNGFLLPLFRLIIECDELIIFED